MKRTLAAVLTTGALLAAPAVRAQAKTPWDCTTESLAQHLPTGLWLHEVGLVASKPGQSVAELQAQARQRATRGLEERVCAGLACPEVRMEIGATVVGAGTDHVCALALVQAETVRRWHSPDLKGFQAGLDAGLERLLKPHVGAAPLCTPDDTCTLAPAPGKKPLRVALVVGEVTDGGMQGGERADWLRDQLLARMSRWEGAVQLRAAPRGWDGVELPPGSDVLLSANVVTFAGLSTPHVDVTMAAMFRGKRGAPPVVRVAQAVRVAESKLPAPAPTSSFPTLASTPGLVLRTDTRDGSICPGQYVQLKVRSDRRRFVRVFNLFGSGKDRRATLIFPNSQVAAAQKRGAVGAGETSLAESGFQAYPLGTDGEGFLVLAADTEEGLGEFAAMTSECRVGKRTTQRLWNPTRLGKALAKDLGGYRIISRESCPESYEEPPTVEATEQALAALPECPEGGAQKVAAPGRP